MFFYFFTLLGLWLVALGLSDLRPELSTELEGLSKILLAGMAAVALWAGCKWAWAGFRWALPKADGKPDKAPERDGELDKAPAKRKPDKAPERDGDASYEEHKPALYVKQGGAEGYGIKATCNGCRQQYLMKDFEIDHIHPQAKGGGHEIENLQLLCGNCNNRKRDRTMAYLWESLRDDGIIPDKAPERDGDASYEEHKPELYEKQGGAEGYGIKATCSGCRQQYLMKDFEIDHIHPQAKGGGHETENLQLLCGNCNQRKGKGTMAELRESLRDAGIIPDKEASA